MNRYEFLEMQQRAQRGTSAVLLPHNWSYVTVLVDNYEY